MQNYELISKGTYAGPRTPDFVYVTSFLFIREQGKKYLVLKLKNSRGERVEEINLKVTLLDKKGRTVSVLHPSSDKGGEADCSFAFGEKIEVGEECCDFTAKVESAVYGGYLYREGKDGVEIDCAAARGGDFDVSPKIAAMRGKTRTVAERRLGIPVLVTLLTCLLLACAALVTYFQLKDFIEDATGFTHYGVLYEFVDGDKSEGSDIIVTGLRGSRPNIVIPEKIDGHTVTEIRAEAFKGNGKIKRLKIEGGVKIGEYAFAGCGRLVSVQMDKAAEVGGYAFAECGALTSLEISGEGEIALESYAFKDCTRLERVKIQKRIIYPEDVAIFSGDFSVKELYLENYGGGRLSLLFGGENGSLESLTISYLDGIGEYFCDGFGGLERVSIAYIEGEGYGISDYAFRGTALSGLQIPEGLNSVGAYAFNGTQINSFNAYGVESIGEYAFLDCRQLTSFTLPENITSLERGTFSGCFELESFTFESGDNLEYVGDYAFSHCHSLKSVTIPDSVEYMGYQVFVDCESLTSLTLPFIGQSVDNSKVLGYLVDSEASNPETNLKSITLTRATSLASYAFDGCSSLREINLNEGLKNIGGLAFNYCTGLKSIVIPASVEYVESAVFQGCYRLYEVYNLSNAQIRCEYSLAIYSSLQQSVEKVEKDGYTVALSGGGFAYPAGWYLIDVPEEQNLNLPQSFDGVPLFTVIDYLFYCESGITSITLPEAVAGIGKLAFYGCNCLERVSLPVTAPVREIDTETFYGCNALKAFTLPAAVARIGEGAFYDCSALETVEFCKDIKTISNYAFANCNSLTKLYIPNVNAVELGEYSFGNCTALTEVYIESGVTFIGERAFSGNFSLERVDIPYAEGTVGGFAFSGCSSLTEMVIPAGMTSIAPYAFEECRNLRKVTLPSTLGEIGEFAFDGCERLRAVVNYSKLNIYNDNDNGGVGKVAVFIVKNFTDAQMLGYDDVGGVTFLHLWYEWVAVWCGDGVTSINLSQTDFNNNRITLKVAPNAFAYNTRLTSVTLSGFTQIGENAFNSCISLKEVKLLSPELTRIEEGTFANCSSLQSVTFSEGLAEICDYAFEFADVLNLRLPSTVKRVGDGAFHANYSMQTAELPKSLTAIGSRAFNGCTSLASINLQDTSLKNLGEGAFLNCTALTYLSLPDTLTEIPALAFCSCRALADVVIPRYVSAIGDEAFYGCSSLLQVHNLSQLVLRAGSTLNGYCSFYALYVFNDKDAAMKFAEENGYKFAGYGGNWYLYGYENYESCKKLPQSFTFEKTEISSYVIREGAFLSGASIVIPASVSAIQDGAIVNPYAIYYCGTAEGWQKIRPASLAGENVYYYSECFHTEGTYWRYAGNDPTTNQTQLIWTVTKEATCTGDGERTGKCHVCGKTVTEKVEKLYHTNVGGKCSRCGLQGVYVTALGGSAECDLTSTNFYADGSGFSSTNTSNGTFAKITLTAKQDMQVFFACSTPSYYDSMTVTAGSETVAEISASYQQSYRVTLSKGQSLSFSYYKGSYSGGNANISYILIYS